MGGGGSLSPTLLAWRVLRGTAPIYVDATICNVGHITS